MCNVAVKHCPIGHNRRCNMRSDLAKPVFTGRCMFAPLWRRYVAAYTFGPMGGHTLCPGNGPEGRACVSGGGTPVRSRNLSGATLARIMAAMGSLHDA